MIIDFSKVEKLLNNKEISTVIIESETGITNRMIGKYRNGESELLNMTIGTAIKLEKLQRKLEEKPMTAIKIKGIKQAVGDFNRWQGAARIYFDKDEMTAWTNVYGGPGSWDEYKGNVVEVMQKATYTIIERDDTTTMFAVQEACERNL